MGFPSQHHYVGDHKLYSMQGPRDMKRTPLSQSEMKDAFSASFYSSEAGLLGNRVP